MPRPGRRISSGRIWSFAAAMPAPFPSTSRRSTPEAVQAAGRRPHQRRTRICNISQEPRPSRHEGGRLRQDCSTVVGDVRDGLGDVRMGDAYMPRAITVDPCAGSSTPRTLLGRVPTVGGRTAGGRWLRWWTGSSGGRLRVMTSQWYSSGRHRRQSNHRRSWSCMRLRLPRTRPTMRSSGWCGPIPDRRRSGS